MNQSKVRSSSVNLGSYVVTGFGANSISAGRQHGRAGRHEGAGRDTETDTKTIGLGWCIMGHAPAWRRFCHCTQAQSDHFESLIGTCTPLELLLLEYCSWEYLAFDAGLLWNCIWFNEYIVWRWQLGVADARYWSWAVRSSPRSNRLSLYCCSLRKHTAVTAAHLWR